MEAPLGFDETELKWESMQMAEPPESWFDSVEPWLDRVLECLEVVTVFALAFGILAATVYEFTWVLTGDPTSRQMRVASILRGLNENWKAGLLLLIPLFYRTVRRFLEQTEEAFGMKRKRPLPGESQTAPNPQQGSRG
jgi:hypothetical protein